MRVLARPPFFKRFAGGALIVAALFALAIGAAFADEAKVGIDNFAFVSDTITIKPGTTVTFENRDDIPASSWIRPASFAPRRWTPTIRSALNSMRRASFLISALSIRI